MDFNVIQSKAANVTATRSLAHQPAILFTGASDHTLNMPESRYSFTMLGLKSSLTALASSSAYSAYLPVICITKKYEGKSGSYLVQNCVHCFKPLYHNWVLTVNKTRSEKKKHLTLSYILYPHCNVTKIDNCEYVLPGNVNGYIKVSLR